MFANDGFNEDLNNASIVPVKDEEGFMDYCRIEATRAITENEEICIEYGKKFWRNPVHYDSLSLESRENKKWITPLYIHPWSL